MTTRQRFATYKKAAGGRPSDGQLAAIARYTLEPPTVENTYVRTAWLAHNAIDRDGEVFSDALLADFARTLPGKGLFITHPGGGDRSAPGVGRWFEARVVEMTPAEAREVLREPELQWPPGTEMARLLEASYYIPRTEKNTSLVADVDAGVAGDVSIGFDATTAEPIEIDGEVLAHRLMGPGEAFEGSLVWLGAQPGARVHKAAGRGQDDNEDDEMSQKQTDELEAQLKAVKADRDEKAREAEKHAKAATKLDALGKALGEEDAALLDEPEQLKAAVTAGRAARQKTIDDLVAAERVAGLVGDTDEDVKAAKDAYANAADEFLAKRLEAVQKSGKRPQGDVDGGNPNTTTTDEKDADGGLRDSSVTEKAVGGKTA